MYLLKIKNNCSVAATRATTNNGVTVSGIECSVAFELVVYLVTTEIHLLV